MAISRRSFMRCVSYCTARSYDLPALANLFKRKDYLIRLSKDVLYVTHLKKSTDLFFFSHGCFVSWGLSKRQEQKWLAEVRSYSQGSLAVVEIDQFCYRLGEETSIDTHERFRVDVITLDSDNPQIKLALSYGLAQSIKLEAFEDAIQEEIRKNGHLPEQIASTGSISLSRRATFKRMGEIFLARSSINLNSEFLDTPEFFWRNPNLEEFYTLIKKFLDIPGRVMSLNQKLDVLQELFDILNSQLQHRHSSLLEMVIILLILIEIGISLVELIIRGLA